MLIEIIKSKEPERKCGCAPRYNSFVSMPCFTSDNKLFHNTSYKDEAYGAQFPYTLKEWNTIGGTDKYIHPTCDKIPYRIIKNPLKDRNNYANRDGGE